MFGNGITYHGFATKLYILRDELEKLNDKKKHVVMFNDAYDVLLFQGKNDILKKFKRFNATIVFGAESVCMPDVTFGPKYPKLTKENENGDFLVIELTIIINAALYYNPQ